MNKYVTVKLEDVEFEYESFEYIISSLNRIREENPGYDQYFIEDVQAPYQGDTSTVAFGKREETPAEKDERFSEESDRLLARHKLDEDTARALYKTLKLRFGNE